MGGFPIWLAALVMAVCALVVAIWIRLARALQIEDTPGARRVHALTTPRGGGIGIVFGLLVTVVAASELLTQAGGRDRLFVLVAGVFAFAAVGMLDDLRPLGAAGKLAAQMVAAALAVGGFQAAFAGGGALLALAFFAAWLASVNLWNFMDGSNGMVALQSLLIALTLVFWPGGTDELHWLAGGLAAACCGFLPFNFPRAKVFLGDVGSHVLGAMLFLLLAMAWRSGALYWAQAAMLGSAFLIDGGLTLARRACRGRPVWRAHREHLYQYAVRKGHSHAIVAIAYAGWTLGMAGLALSPLAATPARAAVTLAAVLVAGGLGHGALRQHWLQRHGKELNA